jgi:uncharacterized membrane protein
MENYTVHESRLRSLVKSVVYRLISIIGTGLLTWAITRNVGQALSITAIIQVFLIILYYVYERVWSGISWERKIERRP